MKEWLGEIYITAIGLAVCVGILISCKPHERPIPEAKGNNQEPPQCDIKLEDQKWELKRGEIDIIRLKVCGGWLIKSNKNSKSSFIFYKDENHLW